jgi:hypothetical protein
MKKFSVLVAFALLAVAGTGYAVTCAYDNVPGASLLIPYFKVGGTFDAAGYLTAVGTDTKIAIVNVSNPGVIAHVTVWNKYSKAVLDFNVPLTGKDVAYFNMSQVLNGDLNVNPLTQVLPVDDVCGADPATASYDPTNFIGWAAQEFLRFPNPSSTVAGALDHLQSISKYASPDAFAAFRARVVDSLDESSDIREFQSSSGLGILDTTNPACGLGSGTLPPRGELTGYLTIDVVNFCTNFFPDQANFYEYDAVATAGWGPTYTPNVLIGDVFYVDPAANVGNISGDQAIALEFDTRLNWTAPAAPPKTFFGRFVAALSTCEQSGGTGCAVNAGTVGQPTFVFGGDGREPLGDRYGFRYLSDEINGLRTWLLVWRSDQVVTPTGVNYNLCGWLTGTATIAKGRSGYGFYDSNHQVIALTFDNDESLFTPGIPAGPSGNPPGSTPVNYIFLEASRYDLLANTQINPGYSKANGSFTGGWIDMTLRNAGYAGLTAATGLYNQGWVGVQSTGPGQLLSVGYSGTNLNQQFQCLPPIVFGPGNDPGTPVNPGLAAGFDR